MAAQAAPDPPRITYHAPGRTFDRLFKEASLAETKDVVRAKLRLAPGAGVALTQLRDGQRIDLEDDGDFEALKALAGAASHVVVLVSVDGQTWPGPDRLRPAEGSAGGSNNALASKNRGRRQKSVVSSTEPPATSAPTFASVPASASTPATGSEAEESGPKRKKRKVAFDESRSTAAEPAVPDSPEKRKRKDKANARLSSQPASVPDSTPPEVAMPKATEVQAPQAGPSRSRPATREPENGLDSDKKEKKHKKKKLQTEAEAAPAPSTIVTTEEQVVSAASRPPPTSILPPSSFARPRSPEGKRKRKRRTSPSLSETPALAPESEATEPPKKKKKKNKHKPDTDALSAAVPPSPKKDVHAGREESVQALAAPESTEMPAKRRKNKHAQDAGPSAPASPSPKDAHTKDKELKAPAAPVAAPESNEPPTKKKKKSKHADVDPASIPLPPSPKSAPAEVEESSKAPADSAVFEPQEGSERKIKRKKSKPRLDSSPELGPVPPTAPAEAESAASVGTAEKELKKRKSKASLPEPVVADADESVSAQVLEIAEPKPGRRKSRTLWVKASAMHVDQPIWTSAPPNASSEPKREKRQSKAAAAVEQSVSASAPQGPKPSKQKRTDNAESSSEGNPKAKKGRKSQGPVDPLRFQALEADLQAAFDLVVHGKTASASPAEPSAQPKPAKPPTQSKPSEPSTQPEPAESPSPSSSAPLPAKKGRSKSRLNVSWGPADFAKAGSPESDASDSEGEDAVPLVDKSADVVEKPAEEAEEEESDAEEEVEEAHVSVSKPPALVVSPSISRIDTSMLDGIQRPSTPTFPAGTRISEVTVESRDEGSSNEGSDSDSDDEEDGAEHAASGEEEEEEEPVPALTQVSVQSEGPSSALPPPSSYDDQLEALIRGPPRSGPRRSVLDELPSESTTEDEEDKDESPLPVMDDEDDEDEVKEQSKSFKKARSASSSDVEPETEAEADEPAVFMDGSQEVPPAEPSPPAFGGHALRAPEEVDEKEPSYEVEDNAPEPPADNDAHSDRASEQSTSNAQTAVDGHVSDKAALLSPVLAPTSVRAEPELQESRRRSASPDSETTVKGGEDREPETTKESETSDQPAPLDIDTAVKDAEIPESEPTSPAVDHEAQDEQPVAKPIQPEGTTSQESSIADDEAQQPSTAGDTATQEPSTTENNDDIESIEPADDLEERRRRVPEPDDDPIEVDLTQRAGAAMRTPSPVATASRPGTIQRMKDRNGKRVSLGIGLPVLASQTSETANNAANAPARRSGRLASRPSGSQASSQEAAPAPAPAPAPKRRGRQPLSEEEKAARAAAKQAEKDAKAAARQAEKEEKARIRQEKERAKREEKEAKAAKKPASKASTARKAPASKRAATVPPPPEPEPEQTASTARPASAPQPASPTPSQEATQQSLVAWATLRSQSSAPGLAPSEVSAVDQLRSSSPAANEKTIAAKASSSILVPDSSQPIHESSDDLPYEKTPLFLPGSSQYPITQSAVKLSSPPRARGGSASEHSDSDGETPLPQKKRAATQQRGHPFRRLTDIASQSSLFLSPGVVTSTPYALRPPPGQKRINHRLEVDDDDDDDDSSGSDSDAPPKSHIPKNRRAGAGRKSGRPSGLRSLTQ